MARNTDCSSCGKDVAVCTCFRSWTRLVTPKKPEYAKRIDLTEEDLRPGTDRSLVPRWSDFRGSVLRFYHAHQIVFTDSIGNVYVLKDRGDELKREAEARPCTLR